MASEPFQDSIGARVVVAFSHPDSLWRTLGGIARSSGLTTEDVLAYIRENETCFVQSRLKLGGLPLYGVRRDLLPLEPAQPLPESNMDSAS